MTEKQRQNLARNAYWRNFDLLDEPEHEIDGIEAGRIATLVEKLVLAELEKLDASPESCSYCGGDCETDENNACDGYAGDVDGLYLENNEENRETIADAYIEGLSTKDMSRILYDQLCENMETDDSVFQHYAEWYSN